MRSWATRKRITEINHSFAPRTSVTICEGVRITTATYLADRLLGNFPEHVGRLYRRTGELGPPRHPRRSESWACGRRACGSARDKVATDISAVAVIVALVVIRALVAAPAPTMDA